MFRFISAFIAVVALTVPALAKDGSGSFSSHKNYTVSGKATVSGKR